MLVLGIESSCDETGVALYDTERGLLAHHLHTQMAMHAEYGGVVPELASRDHIRRVVPLTQGCLKEAGVGYADIDAVAFTQGPGLGGALLAGSGFANALAFAIRQARYPPFTILKAICSRLCWQTTSLNFHLSHCWCRADIRNFMAVRGIGDYTLLGESVDDAAGEAFDKTAKLLGLPYPGGAKLSELAKLGTPDAFTFPRPMLHSHDLQMSFSGLKTAVLTAVEKVRAETGNDEIPEQTRNDICRAFQDAVVDVLAAKAKKALLDTGFRTLVVAGGVGANWKLRDEFSRLTVKIPSEKGKPKPQEEKINVYFPPMAYCTDNGAMIAFAGAMRLAERQAVGAFNVKPRWPLSDIVKQG